MLGVLGDLVEDIVVWVDEPIRYGTDCGGAQVFRTRGGSAANVAAFAAERFPTRFFGCVGDDPAGDFVVQNLVELGAEVVVQRRGTTGTIVLLIDENGERTMLPDRGASLLLRAVAQSDLRGLDLLHVPAYAFQGDDLRHEVVSTIHRAAKLGIPLSIDASSAGMLTTFGADRFLGLISELKPEFLIANKDEAHVLGLSGSHAVNRLDAMPSTTVVLKNGAEATRLRRSDGLDISVPVPAVPDIRDSTGAGDAFAAGFLSTFLRNGDLTLACEGGHALAAAVLHRPGASMAPSC